MPKDKGGHGSNKRKDELSAKNVKGAQSLAAPEQKLDKGPRRKTGRGNAKAAGLYAKA